MDLLKELIKETPLQEAVAVGPQYTVNAMKWRKARRGLESKVDALEELLTKPDIEKLAELAESLGGDRATVNAMSKAFDKFYKEFQDMIMDVGLAIEAADEED